MAVEDDLVMAGAHPGHIQRKARHPGRRGGVLKAQNINILEAEIKTNEKNQGLSRFTLQVHDTTQLTRILKSIQKVPGVLKVNRS